MLRQKKKAREELLEMDSQIEKNKQLLKESAEKDGVKVIDRAALGSKEKISTLLLEMVNPLFYEANDEEDVRGIVAMGVTAWNSGIIKATSGASELNKLMKSFKSEGFDYEKKLLDEYIQIKCDKYGRYNDIITKFELSFEKGGKLNLTVLTGVTDEISKTLNN